MLPRILIFLFLPVFSFCQNQFRFDNFSIKDGLSQNTVHCVLKDKEGYYWLGTQDGLNRYDGYSIKVFRHDKNDSTTISDNFILTMIEDQSGNLWIGTRNGINHFNKKTEQFTKIIVNEKERNHFHASVWNTFLDRDGNVLYSNIYYDLVKITAEDGKTAPFQPQVLADSTILHRISPEKYCLVKPRQKKIEGFNSSNNKTWEVNDTLFGHIYAVVESSQGTKLVGSSTGLYRVSESGLAPVERFLGKGINKLLYDAHRNLWVGTSGGLYIFPNSDLSTEPQILLHSTEDMHSLGSSSIQELYEDPDGLIWVGTAEGGVSIYDPGKSVFKILNHTSPIALSGNSIWGILQDKNELWVGTNSGLNHLTFQNENISGIYWGKNKLVSQETITTSNSPICGNSITAIVKDKTGNLWFASNNNGISVFNPQKKNWKQINTTNSPFKSNVIFHLFCASDGKIWISTLAGFYSYDPATDLFRSFLSTSYEKNGFPSGYIISIFEDREKTIWIGSTGGVYHLTANGERIAIYTSEPSKPNSLSYNMATSFCQDSKGKIWVGTLGGGIDLFDPKTETFRAFTKNEGLSNDITYQILEDKAGKLWISTNTGISCFDPEKEIFANYSERDGIVSNEFSQNSGFRNDAGEILLGSPEGLVIFNPADLRNTGKEIPVLLSSLKVNYEPADLLEGNEIELYYGDKTVTFEFTAPDFSRQEKIQYAFQLEGFDDQWHEVPASSRIASFTNLPFGNYVFKVRIKAGNGEWQEKQLAIPVNVIPPFWLRTWFIILEILLGLALIVLLVRYYAQRKLKKQLQLVEMQQKIHLEKERISRDLHDNVGAHLTYIITSLDNMSYKIEKGEKNVSPEKISSLSDFSRSTMQQLRESIWAINKQNITLSELKDKISEYSGRMASASNMNFNIEFDSKIDPQLKPSLAINIYRVVQEAINNSVKHSQAKMLSVVISKNGGNYVSINVKDNGKGIRPSLQGNGYGLKNMQDRVKDLGGAISIDSGEHGTNVSFTIPI